MAVRLPAGESPRVARAFTLLELMIALAVLAIVSIAVLGRSGESARQLYSLEERTLARWVAENEIASMRLQRRVRATEAPGQDAGRREPGGSNIPLGSRRNLVVQGERRWRVVRETKSTSSPLLRRIEVSVFAVQDGRDIGPLDTLTAFVGQH